MLVKAEVNGYLLLFFVFRGYSLEKPDL